MRGKRSRFIKKDIDIVYSKNTATDDRKYS